MYQKCVWILVAVAVLLVSQVVMAEEAKEEVWKPSAGTGLLFGVDNKEGILLDNRGLAIWVDFLKPMKFNLMGRDWEVNTRAVFQDGATSATENDYLGGLSVGVKGVTFYKSDTWKLGIDPCILINASEIYRNVFEKEEFVLSEAFEVDAICYIGFYF